MKSYFLKTTPNVKTPPPKPIVYIDEAKNLSEEAKSVLYYDKAQNKFYRLSGKLLDVEIMIDGVKRKARIKNIDYDKNGELILDLEIL